MASLKALLCEYPEKDFWLGVDFPQKLNSLVVLRSGYYHSELQKKYNRFKYEIPLPTKLKLKPKSDNDYNPPNKNKTLRDFLS